MSSLGAGEKEGGFQKNALPIHLPGHGHGLAWPQRWILIILVLFWSISSPPAAFVCEDGWTLSDEMCFKVVETALSFADASTACAGLATNGLLAAPKSETILNTLNTLNQNGDDVWIGLDDR